MAMMAIHSSMAKHTEQRKRLATVTQLGERKLSRKTDVADVPREPTSRPRPAPRKRASPAALREAIEQATALQTMRFRRSQNAVPTSGFTELLIGVSALVGLLGVWVTLSG
jgi:hypothetical protein